MIVYKFVELSIVTDETIEEVVNLFVRQGWQWDGIRFVTSESSRRPQMAFVSFVREGGEIAPAPTPPKDDPPGADGPRPKPRLVTD